MEIYWYIPSHTDGPYLSTPHRARAASLHYLTQIARAADQLGYVGVLVPTGTVCEDAWITASFLAPATTQLRYIVAVRPGQSTPAMTARMAAAFDRYSGGRLIVNVVCGGDPVELAGDGVFLDHDTRYTLADEYLEAWSGLLKGETVDLRGDHVHIEGGHLRYLPLQAPHPPLMCGASSSAGQAFASKWIDTVLTWGEPPDQVATKITEMKAAAAAAGREVRFGIRLHTIVRETTAEAWAAADDLIRYVRDEDIEDSQAVLGRSESEGQKRMVALHGGSRDHLEVSPNLWAGIGLVTGGAGTALVGSSEEVSDRIMEYHDIGIDTFILSGYPHLEECYRVAEMLFPKLPFEPATDPLRPEVIPGGW
jgi:alkanesulfonate monooxygenase